jgi:superfamily II DNA or RNA helicase
VNGALDLAALNRALPAFSGRDSGRDLANGRAYHAQGRVSALQQLVHESGDLVFTGRIKGTAPAPYTALLTFDAEDGMLVDAECSCPVGAFCKHSAALIEALRRELARDAADPALSGRDPVLRAPAPKLDGQTERWLASLAATGRAPLVESASPAPPERLLFVISMPTPEAAELRIERARVTPDGNLGPGMIVNPWALDWTRDPAVVPGDQAIVVRIGGFSMGYFSLYGSGGARTLAEVVATGRAVFAAEFARVPLREGGRRSGELSFVTDVRGWQSPSVSLDVPVHVLPLSPSYYIDPKTGETGPLEVAGASEAFLSTWLLGSRIAPGDAELLASRLAAVRLPMSLPAPRIRKTREVKVTPTAVLRLESELEARPAPWAGHTQVAPPDRPWARISFEYDGHVIDPTKGEQSRVVGDEVVTVRRSPAAEGALLDALAEAGLVPVQRARAGRGYTMPSGAAYSIAKISPFAFASRVSALASSAVRVEKAPDYAFDALVADELQLQLDDVEGVDEVESQLAVTLGIKVGNERLATLPLVLTALRERFPDENESLVVPLPDGRAILVPAARLAPLRTLLMELLGEPNPLRLAPTRALALDPAVLARSPRSLTKLRAALMSPRRVAVPKALRATLREYQREGFVWLMARRRAHLGAVLADDMGLGKTVQTLALLLAEERDRVPSLVVCPKSVIGNWEAEAQRFAPSLKVHVHHGPDRATRVASFETADVILTTYPLLVRDAELLASRRFATVVLDEAQTIKTAASTYTHAVCALRADFRLALSGTPMENHLGELWSVMRFVLPELLGDGKSFARTFRRPIERDGGSDEARNALVERLAPFILRRRKEQVASELPPKTIIVEPVTLEDAQRDVYETVRSAMDKRVREALAARGMARSHIVVLDALLKLRQAVCDPRLLAMKTAKKAGSAKLDVLVEKLRELVAEGRRVLVFSQFVTMLELIQNELRREEIPFLVLTGKTENRAEIVAAFQRGAAPVFLLSLKAGGTGLNLTAADVVIHYDPWWNPAAEAQATDRAHRIGQDKPVLVYKLVGKGTIEEKILVLQAKKSALFASIMDDGAGVAKKLTAADVEFLFAR